MSSQVWCQQQNDDKKQCTCNTKKHWCTFYIGFNFSRTMQMSSLTFLLFILVRLGFLHLILVRYICIHFKISLLFHCSMVLKLISANSSILAVFLRDLIGAVWITNRISCSSNLLLIYIKNVISNSCLLLEKGR